MISGPVRSLELTEHQEKSVDASILTRTDALLLDSRFRDYVRISRTLSGATWDLTPGDWIGHLPISNDLVLYIQPKVPLQNVFGMLDVAYEARFEIPKGATECQSLEDFFDKLASVLAKRVLQRARRGLHRAYINVEERTPCVRGRIDLRSLIRQRAIVALDCHFEEHTGDIEDNQILLYTLWRIAASGCCTPDTSSLVRRAYRTLHGFAQLHPFTPADCTSRLYHRLNLDYKPLHGLCRFFLEHTGPIHASGDHTMLPFLIDMPRLYELFVAQWLKKHLPKEFEIRAQERVTLSEGRFVCDIDLVLYQTDSAKTLCVLDTKYKAPEYADQNDIYQVNAYAGLKGCPSAFLVYPSTTVRHLDVQIGTTRIQNLVFRIDQDLDLAGGEFLNALLTRL